MARRWLAVLVVAAGAAAAAPGAAAANSPYPPRSPWPAMRHDPRNTGASPIVARYGGDRPWSYRTGKGIFSAPVIGPDGAVYVGSADSWFYAVDPNGRVRWRFKTGNIIDAGAAIGRHDRKLGTDPITVPSGDEHLYRLRSDRRRESHGRRVIWTLKARQPPGAGQLVDWWEGPSVLGPDGDVYSGNTGDAAYSITPRGKVRWIYRSSGSFWTAPAVGPDGTSYWGSLDLFVHAIDSSGHDLWKDPTLGFIVSSPALSRDGTLYVGSFDSNLYAIDARTGLVRWKFPTADHIYSSPALVEDRAGNVREIVIASTDGSVYGVSPQGNEIWHYDTGDPVRSSPAIGRAPGGGRIVYVGSSNGRLYALDAETGRRRWSFDTTPRSPILRDRNDLNASPALGRTGVYIGGESGDVWYVPYDYCLHRRDPRCDTSPRGAFGADTDRVFYVSPGGSTEPGGPRSRLPASSILDARLVVHKGGRTVNASMLDLPSPQGLVSAKPHFPFTVQTSGDGHYAFIRPDGILRPNARYAVRLRGTYLSGGERLGNETIGGVPSGRFDDVIRFRTAPAGGPLPLRVGGRRVTAFVIRRLAVPEPSFLPSVNQIGFDSYEWLVGAVRVAPRGGRRGSLLVWVIGARRDARGRYHPDPKRSFSFPLSGEYLGDDFALSAQRLTLTFSFGPVPLENFDLRGQLRPDLRVRPGASLLADAVCATVPNYGPVLPLTGLCNHEGKLVASGTYITEPYRGPGANRRPRGVRVASLDLQRPTAVAGGSATARLALRKGASYPAKRHLVSILLTDADTGRPVALDYQATTTTARDARGNVASVRLDIPAGTQLPARVRAYVIADVFPLASKVL